MRGTIAALKKRRCSIYHAHPQAFRVFAATKIDPDDRPAIKEAAQFLQEDPAAVGSNSASSSIQPALSAHDLLLADDAPDLDQVRARLG